MTLTFEWYDRQLGAPTVTVAEYGLVFNESAIRTLGKPGRVMLGFDKRELVIAVKALMGTESLNSRSFPFAERIRGGFARINSKDFVRYISLYLPQPITKGVRCIARWDEEKKLMMIDLRQALDIEGTESVSSAN